MHPPILKDKKGNLVREFDIIKVLHFYGKKCGKGYKKYYMYKIAKIKETKIGPQWFFYHSPKTFLEEQNNINGGYWAHIVKNNEEFTLTDAEIIDSTLALEEEFGENGTAFIKNG